MGIFSDEGHAALCGKGSLLTVAAHAAARIVNKTREAILGGAWVGRR